MNSSKNLQVSSVLSILSHTRRVTCAGLPAYQKILFRYILEGLGMENIGTFYGYLVYFKGH
jgi:hypothetical protein